MRRLFASTQLTILRIYTSACEEWIGDIYVVWGRALFECQHHSRRVSRTSSSQKAYLRVITHQSCGSTIQDTHATRLHTRSSDRAVGKPKGLTSVKLNQTHGVCISSTKCGKLVKDAARLQGLIVILHTLTLNGILWWKNVIGGN